MLGIYDDLGKEGLFAAQGYMTDAQQKNPKPFKIDQLEARKVDIACPRCVRFSTSRRAI